MGLIDRARGGEIGALARLLSVVEQGTDQGRAAIQRLYPMTGAAHRIGVTGPPGAGKSSLLHHLIAAFRKRGRRVAVVAVDPSSRASGGATLGDRIRLLSHYGDEAVFVRSLASRGQRGGLSASTIDVAHVLDAVGFDPILIETLGVGQDEIDIVRVVDTSISVQVPGLGDAIQTLKAGIMEVGDIIAVNKFDLPGASTLVRDIRAMLELTQRESGDWVPPVVPVSAATGAGVDDLMVAVDKRVSFLSDPARGAQRRMAIAQAEIDLLLRANLERRLSAQMGSGDVGLIADVANRRISADAAVGRLLRL